MFRWLILLFLAAFSFPSSAGPSLPDTAPGRAFAGYIDAFNAHDVERMRAFGKANNWDIEPDGPIQWSRTIGGMKVLKVLDSTADELLVLVEQTDSEQVMRGTVRTGGPHLFIGFEMAERPDDLAIPRMAGPEALAALDRRGTAQARKDQFSGVVLIAKRGQVQFEKAWGLADRATGKPLTLDARFRIASLDKMFTAVAVLQLVDAGKLRLDGKLADTLPDYPNRDLAAKVTIRTLLNHTGGTGDVFDETYMKRRLEVRTLADYLKMFGARGLAFEPDSKDDYSNYGYILLGTVIERVSGEDYYAYIDKHIFSPAGMTDTGALPESVTVPRRVNGYTAKDGKWVPDTAFLPWRGTPAGGGYSTARDLLRFAEALQAGKLLPPKQLAEATRPQNIGHWYGYGFETHGKGLARYYSHSGGTYGSNAEFRVYPEIGVVAIALCNIDPNAGTNLVDWYTARMPLIP